MSPEIGARIIMEAKTHLGAHYIHGGYGARPGCDDGFPTHQPRHVNLIYSADRMNPAKRAGEKNNIAIAAASTEIIYTTKDKKTGKDVVVDTYSVCAGSWFTCPGGRGNLSEDDPAVKEALGFAKQAVELQHNPILTYGLSPRRVYGPRPEGSSDGELVLGERCVGIRHFDCVGFISYCIWAATGKKIQLDIPRWTDVPGVLGAQVFELKDARPKELQDGDILVKGDHHIAFAAADGTLYEAQDSHLGVRNSGRFSLGSVGGWTHLVRLPDASLKP